MKPPQNAVPARPGEMTPERGAKRTRLETALVVAVVIAAAIAVRAAYIPSFHDQHVAASEAKYEFDVGDPGEWFSAWSLGDGQAFVLIALDPSGQKLAEEIGEAGYRFARASYGWLGWAGSLGSSTAVPYSLAVVGALSVIGLLVAALFLRDEIGPRAFILLLNPAIYIGFAGDTAEPLAILFLVSGLAWQSPVSSALLGLTRPTYLIALWGRWKLLIPGVVAALALALYSLLAFGLDDMRPGGGRLGLPFAAYLEHSSWAGWALALVAIGVVLIGVRSRDWAWILGGVMVLCLGSDVLASPVNAWRAAGFVPVLIAFGPNFRPEIRLSQLRMGRATPWPDRQIHTG